MKSALASIFILTALSSFGQKATDILVEVDPYLSFQNYEHFKRLTISSNEPQIDYIKGFDFTWGYTYILSVRATPLREVLSDGTQFEYELNEIISKSKSPAATQFELRIDPHLYYYPVEESEREMDQTLKELNDSTFLYFESVTIEIPSEWRFEFDELRKGNTSKKGRFIFVGDDRIRLIGF